MVNRRDILKAEELYHKKRIRQECIVWGATLIAMLSISAIFYFLWG